MRECWSQEPKLRPTFGAIRQKLASLLEEVSDEYSYLKLDSQRDYYNVVYDGETVSALFFGVMCSHGISYIIQQCLTAFWQMR